MHDRCCRLLQRSADWAYSQTGIGRINCSSPSLGCSCVISTDRPSLSRASPAHTTRAESVATVVLYAACSAAV